MRKAVGLLIIVYLFCSTLYAETTASSASLTNNPIRIVHPPEKAQIPALSSTFVLGSVPPTGKLSLNGTPITIHPDGGFLAMVNLEPGEFQIKAEYELDGNIYYFIRTVVVAKSQQATPIHPLKIEYVTPRHDHELLPGDYIEVVCKGSPGAKAYFTIAGIQGLFPMTESTVAPGGIYHGVYQIQDKDRLKNSRIKVTLVNNKNKKVSKESDGFISMFPSNPPSMFEVTSANTVLSAGPSLSKSDKAGYLMYPPEGTILQITGRKGTEYRVRLTNSKTAWVNSGQVERLPEGILPVRAVVGSISVNQAQNSTFIRVPLGRRLPFEVNTNVEGKHIELTLFGAFSNTDWITNAANDIIKNISWRQDDEEAYSLRIDTVANSWWGYDARYEGNTLILELRTPPPVKVSDSPLTGLTIVIDPGHSADTGAIGPTGYMEKDANLAQSLILKEKLIAKGAHVVMTREGNEDVPLRERPRIAWRNRADLLVSIHNNALGYSGNPFVRNGFGVYYYTPMSLPLAKEIHSAYRETFGNSDRFSLRDDGLYYGNLAMTRIPQMPTALIESAYIIVPEEEAYLKTDSFRIACAEAIINGLERYARRMRPVLSTYTD